MARKLRSEVSWKVALDIKRRVRRLLLSGGLPHVKGKRVFCFRSSGTNTRAYARVWGLGRIWQQALDLSPAYVIEVISERFDRLPVKEQDVILIHELLHIPKTFSGALVSHRRRGGVNDRVVREIYLRSKKNGAI